MKLNNLRRGAGMPIGVGIAILVLVVGGALYYGYAQKAEKEAMEKEAMTTKEEGAMMEKEGEVMMKKEGDAMMEKEGTVLAGKASLLLDFKKADYDAALKSGKLIVLYFYANWCPICKAEIPNLYAAFNELTTDKVIGFRVNYNDDQTDSDEKALASLFGVGYQHTKVFVKNGTRILKAPETWNKDKYIAEINKALAN